MKNRPTAVTVVAVILIAAAVMAVVVAVSLIFPNRFLNWIWGLNQTAEQAFRAVQTMAGMLMLALGLATLATGFGLLRGRIWAWWFGVILFSVNAFSNLLSFVIAHAFLRSLFGLAVAGLFLFVMTRPAFRSYCQG